VSIRNGVDAKRLSPEARPADLPELGPPGERKIVLFAGRHDTQKRIPVLLRAFAGVLREVPEARLASAGSGPRLDEYRALAHELGIADKVAFLEARTDVESLLRAASVFVLPSAAEGLPNALLEALASGTPCVATDIPGTREVVAHEKEALLVPVDDAEALAAAIVRLLKDRELAGRLVSAGYERIRREFDMEKVTDQYVELFSDLARTKATCVAHARGTTLLYRLALAMSWRITTLVVRAAARQARGSITKIVLVTKCLLGIEGDIMVRLGVGASARPAEKPPAPASIGSPEP